MLLLINFRLIVGNIPNRKPPTGLSLKHYKWTRPYHANSFSYTPHFSIPPNIFMDHRIPLLNKPTAPYISLFPVSLFVLLMTHTEIHQTVSQTNNTNHGDGHYGGAEWGFKDRLEIGNKDKKSE